MMCPTTVAGCWLRLRRDRGLSWIGREKVDDRLVLSGEVLIGVLRTGFNVVFTPLRIALVHDFMKQGQSSFLDSQVSADNNAVVKRVDVALNRMTSRKPR